MTRAMELILGILIVLCALVFLPQLIWGESALYQDLLSNRVTLFFSSPAKVVGLVAGSAYAGRSAYALGSGNPARRSWILMSAGFGTFALGQSILGVYQLLLGISAPFPSPADPFFMFGYLCFAFAIFDFARAYVGSGLALGSRRALLISILVAAAAAVAIGLVSLAPIATAEGARLEKLLNLAYPILDLILLVPVLALARIASKLIGGQLWSVWWRVLVGFLFMAVGDIAYAYFSTLEITALDPLLDLAFAWAYLFTAWGAVVQYRLTQ